MEEVAPIRICVTGAESTGKSELARALAGHFSVPGIPEYSREYAQRVARALVYTDVAAIARGQIEMEQRMLASRSGLVILDTDLLSTVVYSRHHFGACPEWIESAARERRAGFYLLLDIDVPWIADPVRDSGDTRAQLHDAFRNTLDAFEAQYELISGTWDERFRRALSSIEGTLRPGASPDTRRR